MYDRLLHDPRVMVLPHPIRTDAATGYPPDTRMFELMGVMPALRPYLTDPLTPTEWIINHAPGMRLVTMAHLGLLDGQLGSYILMLNRARLRAHGDPILEVTPALQTMLAQTDLQDGLPVRFLHNLETMVYIRFARHNPLRVPHRLSGLHECEGAYIATYPLPPQHEMLIGPERIKLLGLDPAKPARAIEVVIIGSPVGKADALDDASQDFLLLIQDEDEALSAVLKRHMAFYNNPAVHNLPGMVPADPREVAMIEPVANELAKVLLYLSLPEAERTPLPERTNLERRLRQFGKKLSAKRRERLSLVYDRIMIGPHAAPDLPVESEAAGGDGSRTVRPHWRRGHFRRILYGEGLCDSRIGWIRPTLVNAAAAFGLNRPRPEDSR